MTAGRIDIDVDLSPASLASSLGKFGALALGAAGVSASFGAVLKIGNDFTSTMNTLQAVSSATAAQMAQVSAKAKELGNDISLPGTSASDAAVAMTELAKGGFSVEQAMTAAKGTLQLAAAAQIDAATAAGIQSKALQTFGLDANYAAKAADILANTANASSAEISDVALGLQSGGAVAHQFGLSIEDTAAALGVLANQGIRGSDAGTLLKSSLLAITDQGKPAQKAISDLGLTLYDAQGRFVGIDSEFKQLGEAAKRMTPEMYQAATSTLYGSDAARIAGIAADGGAQKFEAMRAAVDKNGTAAEVANAKMKGLPGALQRVENAAQDAALKLYDLVDGPLEKLSNQGAAQLTAATPRIAADLQNVGNVAVPVAKAVGETAKAFLELPAPVLAAAGALILLRTTALGQGITSTITSAATGMRTFATASNELRVAAEATGAPITRMTANMATLATGAARMRELTTLANTLRLPATGNFDQQLANGRRGLEQLGAASTVSSEQIRQSAIRSATAYQSVTTAANTARTADATAAQAATDARNRQILASQRLTEAQRAGSATTNEARLLQTNLAAAQAETARTSIAAARAADQLTLAEARQAEATAAARIAADAAAADIARLAAAQSLGAMGTVARGLSNALSSITNAVGGPWIVALAAAAASVSSLMNEAKRAGEQQDILRDSSMGVAKAQRDMAKAFDQSKGSVSGNVLGAVVQQVDTVKASLDKLGDTGPSTIDKIGGAINAAGGLIGGNMDAARKGIGAFTDDTSKNAQQVSEVFKKLGLDNEQLATKIAGSAVDWANLVSSLRGMGDAGQQALDKLQPLRDEFVKSKEAAGLLSPGFIDLAGAIDILRDKSASAGDRLNALKTAMDVLSGKQIPLSEAVASYNKTINDVVESTKNAVDPTKGFGDALVGVNGAVNTVLPNGGALYDQLTKIKDSSLQAAQAAFDQKLQTGSLAEAQQAARDALARTDDALTPLSAQYGLNTDKVKAMAAAMGLVPNDIVTALSVTGGDEAAGQLTTINLLLQKAGAGATVEVKAPTAEARGQLEALGFKVEEIKDHPGVVKVTAPNQEALASLQEIIDKRLPDKTQVIRAAYEGFNNDPTAVAADRAARTTPGGRADGGAIGGIGGPRDDNQLIWASPGEHMLDAEDVGLMGGQSAVYRFRAALHAGNVPKYADGGAVGRTLDTLSGESGKAYQYGGTGNPSWDCSGFISAAYALLKGLDWHQRWFTTESSFGALGFLPGSDPSGRGLSIGVHNGGGGSYSHMAATLAGTNIESGGNGVQVGAGAAGASDSQFENHFYLPGSAFSPPDDGTSTGSRSGRSRGGSKPWSQADELRLNSANISVQQAKDARDKALADPKKSQADKDQANTRVLQAEQRVRDLEAKKSSGQSDSGPSPQAPGLTSNLSDDQISMRDLQRSIDDANAKRNDTYADPTASADDKKKADDDLQKAMNALAAAQKKQAEGLNANASGAAGGSSVASASTISELLGNVAKSFVVGEIQDAFKVFGIDDSGGAIGAAITQGIGYSQKVQAQTPQSFGADELAKQGPVTPGTPGWLEQVAKTLRIPAYVRDSGGPLPHGAAAFNFSGQEEWVLTGQQKQNYAKDMAALRSDALRPFGGDTTPQSVDASVKIENLHTGMTAGEFQTQWKMMQLDQRQRAGSFMGRR